MFGLTRFQSVSIASNLGHENAATTGEESEKAFEMLADIEFSLNLVIHFSERHVDFSQN